MRARVPCLPLLAWLLLVAGPLSALQIDELPRDRIVVDLGAALGRNSAGYAVSGQADPGTQVELRLAFETGAAGPWVPAGAAGPEGRWTGRVTLGGATDWAWIEARDPSSGAVARTENRLAGGDVVAFLGQSELDRLTRSNFSLTDPPALAHPGQVQITIGTPGAPPVWSPVEPGADLTAAIFAMARMWEDNAPPGRKLHLVDLSVSGTNRRALADDFDASRSWSDLAATVASVRADGSEIGLVLESWFAGDRGVGERWPEVFGPLYTGLTPAGRPVPLGAVIPITPKRSYVLDHVLWDLSGQGRGIFEEGVTGWGLFGPHRFDGTDPLAGAIEMPDGRPQSGLRAIDRSRRGVHAFLALPQVARIAVSRRLPVPLDYANGRIGDDGLWTDTSHPSAELDDGLPRFGRHVIAAALVALGHLEVEAPVFDRAAWTSAHAEFWSSAGPITTARQARGLPLPEGMPQVRGFDLNGKAARAELVDGRVRVYPPEGLRLVWRDAIDYGRGGAGGFLDPQADWEAEAWLDLPIVDLGLTGLEGLAVLPILPGDPVLRNGLR